MSRGWYWRSRVQLLRNRRYQKFVLVRVVTGAIAYAVAVQFLPEDTPGLSIAVAIVSAGVAGVASPFDHADHVPGFYDIVLTHPGPRVPDVVRELRAWCGMSGRSARRHCAEVPSTFKAGNTIEEAHDILLRLRNAGAVAELKV